MIHTYVIVVVGHDHGQAILQCHAIEHELRAGIHEEEPPHLCSIANGPVAVDCHVSPGWDGNLTTVVAFEVRGEHQGEGARSSRDGTSVVEGLDCRLGLCPRPYLSAGQPPLMACVGVKGAAVLRTPVVARRVSGAGRKDREGEQRVHGGQA
jgi:hypothetical protein